MTRFLNHEKIPFQALIEPAQDAIRASVKFCKSRFLLVAHDWSMFGFNTHNFKTDRHQRTHENDLGYDLGSAFVIDAADGRPLGPMELRLRTSEGYLSTTVDPIPMPPGHIDELLDVMNRMRQSQLGKELIHVIDREADSVGHYRKWHREGHHFLVRADDDRYVKLPHSPDDTEYQLRDVVASLAHKFQDVCNAEGQAEVLTIREGTGRVCVAEAEVILHRPAKQNTGEKTAQGYKKKILVPGPPLTLRLIVTRVVAKDGRVLAEWCLLTNVLKQDASGATLGRWYAWRWRIETFHKLLKSSGMNAEEWQQTNGAAFLRRLCVAVMACLTVWHLQRDASEEAAVLRAWLVRLSGRLMEHGVESTAPALLAGLEKLLAIDDILQDPELERMLALARKLLPHLIRTD